MVHCVFIHSRALAQFNFNYIKTNWHRK